MSLHIQRLAASTDSATAPELVLIHGWGMSSAIWAKWLPQLRSRCNVTLLDLPGYGASSELPDNSIDGLLAACMQVLPVRAIYIGYSLGGMLAARMAIQYPGRVAALVTLASNARFVADEQWPWAMSSESFAQFSESLAHPDLALKRFAGLQLHGSSDEKQLLKELRGMREQLPEKVLKTSLRWLTEIDLRESVSQLTLPSLFCFGENDALVPVAAAEHFPGSAVAVLPNAPHAVFLSDPQRCAEIILSFLEKHHFIRSAETGVARRRKLDVARSFSRAAATYDSVAELQRQVGEALLKKIPAGLPLVGQSMIDLGCGTGYFHSSLAQKFPRASIVGVDLAEGMVRHAARNHPRGVWLCGDAENLPLAESSIALIFSSLAFQWCENVDALFAEVYRVLSPGGSVVFSTLGPDTLHELRSAWREVDDKTHVNGFLSWQRLSTAITLAGFSAPSAPDEEMVTLEYNKLQELTAELKSLGAHNVNAGRPAGLTGKQRILAFRDAYERQRNDRSYLPASYQVWYGVLTKPQE